MLLRVRAEKTSDNLGFHPFPVSDAKNRWAG